MKNRHAQALGRLGGLRNTKAQQAARRRNLIRGRVHHTYPTWGVTNCNLNLFTGKSVKTSYWWREVNCKECLKQIDLVNPPRNLKAIKRK